MLQNTRKPISSLKQVWEASTFMISILQVWQLRDQRSENFFEVTQTESDEASRSRQATTSACCLNPWNAAHSGGHGEMPENFFFIYKIEEYIDALRILKLEEIKAQILCSSFFVLWPRLSSPKECMAAQGKQRDLFVFYVD